MLNLSNRNDDQKNVLLHAGVCLKVPFNRVTVNKSKEPEGPNEMVDFAGVSWNALFSGNSVVV